MGVPLQNISDTAFWVAILRALESERPDAHFHDPYARLLAGERGEQLLRTLPIGATGGWGTAVRTCVLDELILNSVNRLGVSLVVNLAAGLDTRPYRIALPPSLRWIEADLPPILDHKRNVLGSARPTCQVDRMAVDLLDVTARRAFLAHVESFRVPVLAVSEGFVVYLSDHQVATLADDLAAQPHVQFWVTDIVSERVLTWLQRTWDQPLAGGGARMRFGPRDGLAFFGEHGWRSIDFRSLADEACRLNRAPAAALLLQLAQQLAPSHRRGAYRRDAGYALLERVYR